MQIECDRCEEPFDVPEDQAGGKVPCPYCGDINRAPERGSPLREGLPAEDAPETVIRVVRKSMFRAHPFRYIFIVLLFLGGLTLAAAARPSERLADWLLWPGLILAIAASAWWLIWWITATLWMRIKLTNKRTIWSEGLIRRHTSEVLHDHVRNVRIRQSFLQRLMRVGYIGISSAGQDGIEIEAPDIPDPDTVKAIIDQYRDM